MCGQLRYCCATRPAAVVCCHCMDCQRRTGGAFGISVLVDSGSFEKIGGDAATWESTRESGNVMRLHSCAVCGTRCWAEQPANPKFTVVIGGTLDSAQLLQPAAHIHTAAKHPWISIPEGVYTAEGEPDWRKVFSV